VLRKEDVKVGDKVHYQPSYYLKDDKWENGIVKEVPEHTVSSVRVVYHVRDNDWENYDQYTSAMTDCLDLKEGWR
jgi:hypothetical protein